MILHSLQVRHLLGSIFYFSIRIKRPKVISSAVECRPKPGTNMTCPSLVAQSASLLSYSSSSQDPTRQAKK